jgi:hypothetical protein
MKAACTTALCLATAAALALLITGCGGSFAPTLPNIPGGTGDSVTVPTTGAGIEGSIPTTLNASNFSASINGTPTTVTGASFQGGSSTPLVIAFLIDTTGSMGGVIDGVKSSISAFADTFAGHPVTWAGLEWGDSPRTNFAPSTNLAAFKTWLGTLSAGGGGDTPENPIDALMAARLPASDPSGVGLGWSYPAGVPKYFILFTDAPGHTPGDGGDATVHFTGAQCLTAYQGWATVECVTANLTSSWSGYFDPRIMSDGVSLGTKVNNGTGGKWVQLSYSLDLTTLGITEAILSHYNVTFVVPPGMKGTTATVAVTVTWSGHTVTLNFPGYPL